MDFSTVVNLFERIENDGRKRRGSEECRDAHRGECDGEIRLGIEIEQKERRREGTRQEDDREYEKGAVFQAMGFIRSSRRVPLLFLREAWWILFAEVPISLRVRRERGF